MNKTWFEEAEERGVKKGIEKGFERGFEKGRREVLQELLENRFGPLPAKVVRRLQRMTLAELVPLGKAILHAKSLRDLGLDN